MFMQKPTTKCAHGKFNRTQVECGGLKRKTLPIISDIWSPADDTVWGSGVALLEEVHHGGGGGGGL